MGKETSIEWTDHTFNPWWGCQRISVGCEHCYAETLDNRWHNGKHWGAGATRKIASETYWLQLDQWNRDAKLKKKNALVFVASMSDWAEDRPELIEPRQKLMKAIEKNKYLTFQLLTKRPENIKRFTPPYWWGDCLSGGDSFPDNVWIGITAENQEIWNNRKKYLFEIPCKVKFLSYEPALAPIMLTENVNIELDWVICGGESGTKARAMSSKWAQLMQHQCKQFGIPFFFKQWGEYNEQGVRVGKKKAGSLLQGINYKQFPTII